MTEEEKNKKLYFKLYPPLKTVWESAEEPENPEDRGPLHRIQIIRTDSGSEAERDVNARLIAATGQDASALLMEHRRTPTGKWDLIMYAPVKPEATVDIMTGLYDERIIFTEDIHNVPYSYKSERDMYKLDEYDNIPEQDRLVFRSDQWNGRLSNQLDVSWSQRMGMFRLYNPCHPKESAEYYELGEISAMFADAEARGCGSLIMDTRDMPERIKDMVVHPELHEEEWKNARLNKSEEPGPGGHDTPGE